MGILVLDSAGKYQRMSGEIIAPNQVRISHPGFKTPKSIRYAWEGFPNANLFGEGKMPAFPFRTDQFDPNSEHLGTWTEVKILFSLGAYSDCIVEIVKSPKVEV